MNLKEQLYVCTLAQTGSLSKAAQLFISQPALSLYISNLEKQLGIQLFDRIGKQFL
ncbi:MAG: LysR family transcriptional regulator [Lachnospiraceae bacterium]